LLLSIIVRRRRRVSLFHCPEHISSMLFDTGLPILVW